VSGDAWLEKLVISTEPLSSAAPIGDDALAEIDRALVELIEQGGVAGLSEYLGDLSKKLPAEVLDLMPELRSPSPEWARELASDVRSLLRERLAAGQGG
jgi:hypothetical protein